MALTKITGEGVGAIDSLDVTGTGGQVTVDANGHITSKQSLDAVTAGGRITGATNRGTVSQIELSQTASSADGGYIRFLTCDSGSTSPTERMRLLSGGGLTFNGDTAAANALSDYEEGTFTPTYTEGLTSVSYNFQQGKYTKIGRMVFFEIGIRASAATTNSNQIRIAGLPFTSSNTGGGPYGGAYLIYNNDFFRVDGGPTLLINYNDTELLFYRKSDGSIIAGNNGSVNELNDIYIVGQYTTDA